MPEWKITYNKQFTQSPMTPWVHRGVGGGEEGGPVEYDPPRPLPIPGKGYPTFMITVDRFPFTFASLHELDEAIRVLEQPVLPQFDTPKKKQLPVYRKLDPHNAKSKHWTTRLPKGMEGWAKRRKIVFELKQGRDAIKKSLGPANVARSYGQAEPAIKNQEPRTENRESRTNNHESRIMSREPRTGNRELRTENQESRTENHESNDE